MQRTPVVRSLQRARSERLNAILQAAYSSTLKEPLPPDLLKRLADLS